MSINRKFFFETIRARLFGGKLSQTQVEGITEILNAWEKDYWNRDDRFLAYLLATVFHETDRQFQGIREYGKGKGRKYGVPDKATGQTYYGRGFVQLTWKDNYQKFSNLCDKDFVHNPDLVLELFYCVKIAFIGMVGGYFTGKKLSDYFNDKKEDWINARRIINGTDKANLIADYAKKFYSAISYTSS